MKRVLAIDPVARGFGFAVLDGPKLLVDWGVRATKPSPKPVERALREVAALLERYSPDRVVVEDCHDGYARRGKRSQRLIERIEGLSIPFGSEQVVAERDACDRERRLETEGLVEFRHRGGAVEQASVQDQKKTVRQVLDEAGITVTRFVRFEVGQA